MKNLFFSKPFILSAVFVASAGSQLSNAQQRRSSPPPRQQQDEIQEAVDVEQIGNIIGALNTQVLQSTEGESAYSSPALQLSNVGATGLLGAQTKDGIPGRHGEEEMKIDDLLVRAYTSVQLVNLILEERMTYAALGPRIIYMENGIRQVLAQSGTRLDEQSLRETLNRGLDVMSLVLPITGPNPESAAQWAANFYKSVLELAGGLYNNHRNIIIKRLGESESNGKFSGSRDPVPGLTSAKYGQMFANLLMRNQSVPGTRSAKAVLLMRMIGYLGHDLNEDLGRRDEGIAQTVTDIYRLQNSAVYRTIVEGLRRGQGPSAASLASLRSSVLTIMTKLPERLGNSPKP